MENQDFKMYVPELSYEPIFAGCGGTVGNFGGTAIMKAEEAPDKTGASLVM